MDSIRPVKMQTDSRSIRYIDDPRNCFHFHFHFHCCCLLSVRLWTCTKHGDLSAVAQIPKFFDLTEVIVDYDSQDADRSASARVIVLHFSLNRPLSKS